MSLWIGSNYETIFFKQNKVFMGGYEQDPDSVEVAERK
jgi:hypothetical protein